MPESDIICARKQWMCLRGLSRIADITLVYRYKRADQFNILCRQGM